MTGEPMAESAAERRPLPHWTAEYKLREILARPALAKRIVELVPNHVALELVTAVEATVNRYVTRLQEDLDRITSETMQRMAETADAKLAELRDERFGHPEHSDHPQFDNVCTAHRRAECCYIREHRVSARSPRKATP